MPSPREDAQEQPSSPSSRPPPANDAAAVDTRADVSRVPTNGNGADSTQARPRLVAIVGVEGCGKTTLLRHLELLLGGEAFMFFDATALIESQYGGLDVVRRMGRAELAWLHHHVAAQIQAACRSSGKIGVVAGHMSLLDEEGRMAKVAMTFGDIRAYELCLYIKLPGETVASFHDSDRGHRRPRRDPSILENLQVGDITYLRRFCLDFAVLCEIMRPRSSSITHIGEAVLERLQDFREHNEQENLRRVLSRVDEAVGPAARDADTVVVVDADRVLADLDTRRKWWEAWLLRTWGLRASDEMPAPHQRVVSHERWAQQQSYRTLRQLAHAFECCRQPEYDEICRLAGAGVSMRAEVSRLLYRLKNNLTPTLLVTSGLGGVWEQALRMPLVRLGDHVKVIGGGRISDGFVVTPAARAAVVRWLRERHGMRVFALGMGEEDVPMLEAAGPRGILVAQRGADERDERAEAAVGRAGARPMRLVLGHHSAGGGGSSLDGEVLPGAMPEVGDEDTEATGDILELLDPNWD